MLDPNLADMVDQYILNYAEPTFDPAEIVNVATASELVTQMYNVAVGSKKKIVLTNDINLEGATAGSYAAAKNATIMVCSEPGKHYTINADELSRIFSIAGENSSYYFTDLTLLNGNASDAGGGIQAYTYIASLFIDNCDFINNTKSAVYGAANTVCINSRFINNGIVGTPVFGGAIRTTPGYLAVVFNSYFYNNAATNGGGAMHFAGGMAVIGCDISNNTAGFGGGIGHENNKPYILNSRLTHNRSVVDGGGGARLNGESTIIDCEISSNTSVTDGGGVSIGGSQPSHILGDTCICGNTAQNNGGGLYCNNSSEIGKEVVFCRNKAGKAYLMSDADQAAYYASVKATQFSSGFKYGWNNYDIGYVGGSDLSVPYCVPYKNLINGCSLPCMVTDETGQLDSVPQPPTACIPSGTCFCGWYKDECMTEPITSTTVFVSGDSIYPCFKCRNVRTIYDPAIGSCVSLIGDKGPQGQQGERGLQGPKGNTGLQGPAGEGPDYCELETRIILALVRHGYDTICPTPPRRKFDCCDCNLNMSGWNNPNPWNRRGK
ncbi:hypothetical protein FACS1894184_12280 [Clostridia bacterium]|nr:hypothetical protein FACS1894184_12280 [Clostridia bacterium]